MTGGYSLDHVYILDTTDDCGPQTDQIKALKTPISWMKRSEYLALTVVWRDNNIEARIHARQTAFYLGLEAERHTEAAIWMMWDAAQGDLRQIFRVWGASWHATCDVIYALVVRDLIGDKFTQAHYDLLTRPWRTTIGPIHPQDETDD